MKEHSVEYKEVVLHTAEDITHLKSFLPEEIRDGKVRLPIVFKDREYLGDHENLIRDHQALVSDSWNPDQIFSLLKNNVCSVVFQRLNGETVQLRRCTLREDRLPEEYGEGTSFTNTSFFTVYNLDTDSWRGFSVTSIKSITVTGE